MHSSYNFVKLFTTVCKHVIVYLNYPLYLESQKTLAWKEASYPSNLYLTCKVLWLVLNIST